MDLRSKSVNSVQILEISGRFDALTSHQVEEWLADATQKLPVHIAINLGQVTFIDSTALSTLVAGMKHARIKGGDLRLFKLHQPVQMIFELTRLDKAFEIFNSEEETLQAFAVSS